VVGAQAISQSEVRCKVSMNQIQPAAPRETVQVQFADRVFSGPVGAPLAAFVQIAFPDQVPPIMAAFVDGELEELRYQVRRDIQVELIDTTLNDGMRIYQRSLCFVLIVAIHELYPQAKVLIDHSVALGGFYCQIRHHEPLTPEQVGQVQRRMREIIVSDEPITKERLSRLDALALFASQGYEDKVHLLESSRTDEVSVYALRGIRDYFYGYMAPSTGALRWFDLEPYDGGIILRLPNRTNPTELPQARDYPKLMQVFRQHGHWMSLLQMSDIGALNRAVSEGRILEAILVSEALHEKNISDIADSVLAHRHKDRPADSVRLILIAGPSASGKTTFSRRLAIQLMVNGLRPLAIGLDDYFVDRELTPRDANGDYDFEAFEAIDTALFNAHLTALLAGQEVLLRRFDFKEGKGVPGSKVRLESDDVLIIEGIHGLNPSLVSSIPEACVFRIYVSALTQLNIDHHNRVPTTDTRLIRRTVRDAQYRGYSAKDTIDRWESVRRGEERNIFPYQENADVMFNSALPYELAVLKPFIEPLLLRVPRGTLASVEARRLLAFLRWVHPCEPTLVPDNSILREFIGGSILRGFELEGRV